MIWYSCTCEIFCLGSLFFHFRKTDILTWSAFHLFPPLLQSLHVLVVSCSCTLVVWGALMCLANSICNLWELSLNCVYFFRISFLISKFRYGLIFCTDTPLGPEKRIVQHWQPEVSPLQVAPPIYQKLKKTRERLKKLSLLQQSLKEVLLVTSSIWVISLRRACSVQQGFKFPVPCDFKGLFSFNKI